MEQKRPIDDGKSVGSDRFGGGGGGPGALFDPFFAPKKKPLIGYVPYPESFRGVN